MIRPVIAGCRTSDFPAEQLAAFHEFQPFGLTIFQEPARDGPEAICHVIRQFRDAVGRADAPAFIDQEGGGVMRLKPSFGHGWRDIPPSIRFADLSKRDVQAAQQACFLNAQLIAAEMRTVDIHVNYAPVVDLLTDHTFSGIDDGLHAASGDMRSRMLGSDPHLVARLGRAACRGLIDQGVVPVIKHIPGYGRVRADPHYSVTRVDATAADMEATDFVPFRELADMPAAMLAHVIFTAIDPDSSATLSAKVIALIRDRIGFGNALITDAIEMSAVWPEAFSCDQGIDQFRIPLPRPGMVGEITRRALAAGCDLVLHGDNSRDFAHTVEMMEAAPPCSAAEEARLQRLFSAPPIQPFDRSAAMRRLDDLMAASLPQE
jgi:beta-N-acetylhexosaminidase